MTDDLYAELVLRCVDQVPRGRVTTYGAVATAVRAVLGRGGPRQVGAVMRSDGSGARWWRVVRADGSLPHAHRAEARQAYLGEGTPLLPGGSVDMERAFFQPDPPLVPARHDGGHG